MIQCAQRMGTAGITPEEFMGAMYDKMNKRNKKRIEIFRADGTHFKRYYDYGTAEYLIKNYHQFFNPAFYRIEIYTVGKRNGKLN